MKHKYLSKKESEYRCKIIAENRVKKDSQAHLDNYVDTNFLTYKALYLNNELLRNALA